LTRPYAGWSGDEAVVNVESGLDAGRVLERLEAAGVIRSTFPLRVWLILSGGGDDLHAGEYRFAAPASPLDVLKRLRRGDVVLHAITLPEGLVLEEIAERVAAAGLSNESDLLTAFRDPTPIRDLDERAEDLEGYLFPDTYHFSRDVPAAKIAEAMLLRFREVTGPEFGRAATEVGLGFRDAVTLASLIEKETSVPDERTRIAGVFHNRLRRGMALQCDPTVIYALRREGRITRRLTYDDLEIDSPWNTYRYPGLPPGPIANPGAGSLWAAVEPAKGNELYFVAAPGGGHRFSESLEEHLRAVRQWRAYLKSSR
jgi:UPF0755 protein